jgi:hypothetical protein
MNMGCHVGMIGVLFVRVIHTGLGARHLQALAAITDGRDPIFHDHYVHPERRLLTA